MNQGVKRRQYQSACNKRQVRRTTIEPREKHLHPNKPDKCVCGEPERRKRPKRIFDWPWQPNHPKAPGRGQDVCRQMDGDAENEPAGAEPRGHIRDRQRKDWNKNAVRYDRPVVEDRQYGEVDVRKAQSDEPAQQHDDDLAPVGSQLRHFLARFAVRLTRKTTPPCPNDQVHQGGCVRGGASVPACARVDRGRAFAQTPRARSRR